MKDNLAAQSLEIKQYIINIYILAMNSSPSIMMIFDFLAPLGRKTILVKKKSRAKNDYRG